MTFKYSKENQVWNRVLNLLDIPFLVLEWDKDPERYKLTADSGFAYVTECILNGPCLDMSCSGPFCFKFE